MRRVRFEDPESGKTLIFLTDNTVLPALTIWALYKSRYVIGMHNVVVRRDEEVLANRLAQQIVDVLNPAQSGRLEPPVDARVFVTQLLADLGGVIGAAIDRDENLEVGMGLGAE